MRSPRERGAFPADPLAELVGRLQAAVEALEKQTPGDLLDVEAVRARYGLHDDRTARKLMHEAGAFLVGGRLFVRGCDLERLEVARIERAPRTTPARRGRDDPERARAPRELKPGFWRE